MTYIPRICLTESDLMDSLFVGRNLLVLYVHRPQLSSLACDSHISIEKKALSLEIASGLPSP